MPTTQKILRKFSVRNLQVEVWMERSIAMKYEVKFVRLSFTNGPGKKGGGNEHLNTLAGANSWDMKLPIEVPSRVLVLQACQNLRRQEWYKIGNKMPGEDWHRKYGDIPTKSWIDNQEARSIARVIC